MAQLVAAGREGENNGNEIRLEFEYIINIWWLYNLLLYNVYKYKYMYVFDCYTRMHTSTEACLGHGDMTKA